MPDAAAAPLAKTLRIVSGGQTGVDRAALDAALALGAACGGWCPAGRLAEDGRIPERYPLREISGANYRQRTLRNVIESDGTVIIYRDRLEGGTLQTFLFCIRNARPCRLIDADAVPAGRAAELIRSFVATHAIRTLNVAGPRASKQPRIHAYAFRVISRLLKSAGTGAGRRRPRTSSRGSSAGACTGARPSPPRARR